MAQPTQVQEGFGGNRWMAQAGIDRRRRGIGSLPAPLEQARRAGVLAGVGNVTTRIAFNTAREDYLAVYDPEARRRVASGETFEEATPDYALRVTQHGGELLVHKVAKDAESDGATLEDELATLPLKAELPPERELVGAGIGRLEA